jgi:hypothetical protein
MINKKNIPLLFFGFWSENTKVGYQVQAPVKLRTRSYNGSLPFGAGIICLILEHPVYKM